MKKNTISVITLGCRLNSFESEIIREHAKAANLENTIIINTCTVTQKAHHQAKQEIRKAKKSNPQAKIIVTGCAAQTNPDDFEKMPEVDAVLGNADKMRAETYQHMQKRMHSSLEEITSYPLPLVQGFESRTRAYVQIQQGCDHRCTFCIIHVARGKNKPVDKEHIIAQVEHMVAMGHKEVVLTGVDISSYQRPLFQGAMPKLGELCHQILKNVPKLKRLRLSSLDPAVEDAELIALIAGEDRMMPHMHFSLQSMSAMVLRNMGRRHTPAMASAYMGKLRNARKDIIFGADIIAGFPRETQQQHEETIAMLKSNFVPLLHVFPYSIRHGTPAARMQQVDSNDKKKRAQEIRIVGNRMKEALLIAQQNTIQNVLIENNNQGYTKHYISVKIEASSTAALQIGNEYPVYIIGHNGGHLQGKVLEKTEKIN